MSKPKKPQTSIFITHMRKLLLERTQERYPDAFINEKDKTECTISLCNGEVTIKHAEHSTTINLSNNAMDSYNLLINCIKNLNTINNSTLNINGQAHDTPVEFHYTLHIEDYSQLPAMLKVAELAGISYSQFLINGAPVPEEILKNAYADFRKSEIAALDRKREEASARPGLSC